MPTSKNRFTARDGWLGELNLRHFRFPIISVGPVREVEQAALAVLNAHPPIGFAGESEGSVLTAVQLNERVENAIARARQGYEEQREADAEQRRLDGWNRVEQALTARDADKPITSGRWAGFTRGEATAWCWNLFQYEPHGFVLPGSVLREKALKQLQKGGLPEVFGYPERAREHADRGVTPREYRRMKEALGANTFSPSDVRHSSVPVGAAPATVCESCGGSPAAL